MGRARAFSLHKQLHLPRGQAETRCERRCEATQHRPRRGARGGGDAAPQDGELSHARAQAQRVSVGPAGHMAEETDRIGVASDPLLVRKEVHVVLRDSGERSARGDDTNIWGGGEGGWRRRGKGGGGGGRGAGKQRKGGLRRSHRLGVRAREPAEAVFFEASHVEYAKVSVDVRTAEPNREHWRCDTPHPPYIRKSCPNTSTHPPPIY